MIFLRFCKNSVTEEEE